MYTNTKFTDHAIAYAECQGLSLVGWNYPRKGNLEDLINEAKLHPLTALISLSPNEKRMLLDAGLVLCKQVIERKAELVNLGIDKSRVDAVIEEAEAVNK
jgi:hypothetical protein